MLPSALLLLYALCLLISSVCGCTTVAAGRKATVDGSTLVAHTNDGGGTTDPRIVFIPAMDHEAGSKRLIFVDEDNWPRYCGFQRGPIPAYEPIDENNCVPNTAIGYIPQVNHTFAYFEESYGIVNEHGLGMAESTTSAVFGAPSVGPQGGKALLSIREMTLLGLERCKTARCAVQLMGELAVKYGFYGDSPVDNSVGGEALYVSDPNEVFVFHVLPDDAHTSAIWAAERIHDDHVSMMANMFIIREMNLTDSHRFLFSDNMITIAEKKGWWKQGDAFDFTAIYSYGEYGHQYYSGRRVWGGYKSLGLNYPSSYADLRTSSPYPVSAKLPNNRKISQHDIFQVLRNYYQNTPYDMSQGMAAGAFGNPNRYGGGVGESKVTGNWERSITQYRTSDSYVVQLRNWLDPRVGSVVWYGPHAALGTCYTPFAAGMQQLPDSFSFYSNPVVFERKSMYWAARYAENLATTKWLYASQDIMAVQSHWEDRGVKLQAALDKQWTNANSADLLTAQYSEFADDVVDAWWQISDALMFKYSDGYGAQNETVETGPISTGYPAWWLASDEVGYEDGPTDIVLD